MKVKVIQKENEEPVEILAHHILELARVGYMLKNSRLKEEAVIILLHHETKIAQRDIRKIFDALASLEKLYLKPKGK
mgnify:CR=1 FL=1